ncbi:MAG: translocation/assembly module TamB domain-containing protein, partial [Gemmatimonadales bacterium]
RAALPGTVIQGGGRIDWPRDTILYDFQLEAPTLDLVDLRWISPNFPALSGRGQVIATSVAGSRSAYDVRDLDVAGDGSRVRGRMVALVDVYRGLGFRDLALDLTTLDLEIVRPFLDTLPLAGRISGPLQATGFFDAMTISADWLFQDSRVPEGGTNRLTIEGDLALGGDSGMVFQETRIPHADFDLRTIRLVTPAVALDGRLRLAGSLDGPWQNVTYRGRVEHEDVNRPKSVLGGRARLDTRTATLGLDADLTVDTLAFEGIRGTFPSLTLQGAVSGSLKLSGYLDSLWVEGGLVGGIGAYQFAGRTSLEPPRLGAENLRVSFNQANLAMLSPNGPATSLAGQARLTGVIDSLVAPEAEIDIALHQSSVRSFVMDSAWARLSIRDSLITVDTAGVTWPGGGAFGSGTFGWSAPHQGTLKGTVAALNLAPFDSLAAELAGLRRADLVEEDLMSGRARGTFSLEGSLDRWNALAEVRLDSAVWLRNQVRLGTLDLKASGGALDSLVLGVNMTVDTLAYGKMRFADLEAGLAGTPARFDWNIAGASGSTARVAAHGQWRAGADSVRVLQVDSLGLDLLGRQWRLQRSAMFTIDSVMEADTVLIATDDGSGLVRMEGVLPGRRAGQVHLQASGISLRDLYALAQRDTAGVGGSLGIDVRAAGTLEAPTFRGSATLTGPVVSQVKAPLVRAVFNYDDRMLQSNLSFWRTGRPILDIDARLPLDLSMGEVTRRQIPGELVIRGQADSVDLAVIEALSPNLRGVVGTLALDAQVDGSWDAPRLGGQVTVADAAVYVPGLGVSYGPMFARIRLAGDSIVADSVVIRSDIGEARVGGAIRLAGLTTPVLDLDLSARDFVLIDVPEYMTFRATGDVTLAGPLVRPVLSGSVRATNSVVYFADLLSKNVINLEDPANIDLVDTTALRAQGLGAQFQSRLLDSLTIRDLGVRVAQDVWLRSSEANVQLEGQVTVNKERRRAGRSEFRVSGELTVPRGTYTFRPGLGVARTFTVEQGTVRYFNTPDMNASLDLTARYVVRTVSNTGTDDYPIIARITGTLVAPNLQLTSEPGRQQYPERELVSLLVFGTVSSGVRNTFGNEQQAVAAQVVASLASKALSSELERSLISSKDSPFDLVEISPGFAQGNNAFATGGSVTRLSLGRQLTRRVFATLSLGGCLVEGLQVELNRRYLGATLEYRLHPTLKVQIAAEPVQSCLSQVASSLIRPSRYQFGADIKWDREY